MPWYYAEGTTQNGPVTDDDFAELVRSGRVRGDTLVWREGMTNWQPYVTVAAPAASAAAPPPVAVATAPTANAVVCHECGRTVPKENAIQYGSIFVCASCKPMFVQKLREGAEAVAPVQYAGFWIRVLAKIIDGIILLIVFFVPAIFLFFPAIISGGSQSMREQILSQVLFNVAYWGVLAAYNTFFVGKFGATPGKMACGLRIVVSDMSKVSYMRAFGRSMAEILSSLTCNIGYLIAAFDGQKRALHDHICDTRVVRK